MRRIITVALLAATALGGIASPVLAQSRADQVRWDQAQARYESETQRFEAERDRYYSSRRGYRPGGYDAAPPPPPPPPGYGGYAGNRDDRDEGNYDASQYYRNGPGYQERALASDDRVYRGSDGRYYCKRNDGTTGLIIGAAGGGVLGNVIDGGHSRTAGTLLGAAIGALAGRAVEKQNSEIRCR